MVAKLCHYGDQGDSAVAAAKEAMVPKRRGQTSAFSEAIDKLEAAVEARAARLAEAEAELQAFHENFVSFIMWIERHLSSVTKTMESDKQDKDRKLIFVFEHLTVVRDRVDAHLTRTIDARGGAHIERAMTSLSQLKAGIDVVALQAEREATKKYKLVRDWARVQCPSARYVGCRARQPGRS